MHRIRNSHLRAPFLLLAGILVAAFALTAFRVDRVEAAQAKSGNLQEVLSQMNAASAKFTSAQADLRQDLYDHVVHDTETQTGQIYFIRKSGTTQMGIRMLGADAKPGSPPVQIVEFKDGKFQSLNTGTGQVEVFNATGKNQSVAESILAVGFGGSGTDLEKSWAVTDQGPDSINDGSKSVPVEKLDLISKDPTIRNTYSHITIWIDPARDISLKQESFLVDGGKPTGDTKTVFYSNIRLNQKSVDTAPFAIKCPSKCTFVQH